MEETKMNAALIALLVIGHDILVEDALATRAGRERIKHAFGAALGAVPELTERPEFGMALMIIENPDAIEFNPAVAPDEVTQ
jgi:hypothetical protein